MQSEGKPVDVARLKADLAAASVELLSAHCATDRVRLQYSLEDIAAFGERTILVKAFTSAEALCRFFSQLEAQMRLKNGSPPLT
jgi:hypothetical protein